MPTPHPEQRAADPNTPLDDLAALAEDYPAEVANNPALLLELVTGNDFLRRLTSEAISALLAYRDTPAPILLSLVSELPNFSYMRHKYARQALTNPNLSPEAFALIQHHINNQVVADTPELILRHQHNPDQWQGDPTDLLSEHLHQHGFFSELLDHITALPAWAVEILKHNPCLKNRIPTWEQARTRAEPLPALPMLVMDNALLALELDPHPDPRVITLALTTTAPTIRLALAHNPTVDHQTLQLLSRDPDLAVSQAAQRTLNHPSRAAG